MKAEITLECADPESIIKAIKPDTSPTEKFSAEIKTEKNVLKIIIESPDITGLLAGINSYLRLARTALDVEKIKEEESYG